MMLVVCRYLYIYIDVRGNLSAPNRAKLIQIPVEVVSYSQQPPQPQQQSDEQPFQIPLTSQYKFPRKNSAPSLKIAQTVTSTSSSTPAASVTPPPPPNFTPTAVSPAKTLTLNGINSNLNLVNRPNRRVHHDDDFDETAVAGIRNGPKTPSLN
jgi:hypothetical protein